MTRVLVTGATGFIGRVLCDVLAQAGYRVRAALRMDRSVPVCVAEKVVVGDINSTTDWTQALAGVDFVVHVAARAHVLDDSPANADLYIETNARSTQRLVAGAAQAKIRRFVFLSSVKVNGEETADQAYTPLDEPRPKDAYGHSKWLAEKFVMQAAGSSDMQAVIVRSPLVYGPGVGANFLRLMRWVDKEWPLPLGAIKNRRSLVSIWNLCDLLVQVLKNPIAPGRIWMVSDAEDLSTPDLIRRIGSAMGRHVRLVPVPVGLLQLFAGLVGCRAEIARLCGSLWVDITHTRDELGWSPSVTVDEALARTITWYLGEGRSREA
jgi:nucleoside-diphosphate-sugar epimerase